MIEWEPATTEEIALRLRPISHTEHFIESQRREAEKKLGWFVSSPGNLLGTVERVLDEVVKSDDPFITTHKLRGPERSLNRNTLVYTRSYLIPLDISNPGIDAFLHDSGRDASLSMRIGSVSLNEPGTPIFKPTKTQEVGFVETDAVGTDLAAVGIEHYLNNSQGVNEMEQSVDDIRNYIEHIYTRIPIYRHQRMMNLRQAMKGRRSR